MKYTFVDNIFMYMYMYIAERAKSPRVNQIHSKVLLTRVARAPSKFLKIYE